jgi:L,D-transpeptidase-like protein
MRKVIIILICAIIVIPTLAGGDEKGEKKPKRHFVSFLNDYLSIKYYGKQFDEYVYVSVKKQMLYHIKNNEVVAEYPVSTAKNGVGNTKGSEKTPSGLHSISEKYGDNIPLGGILASRTYNGNIASIEEKPISTGSDDVTTRILWLNGEEPGLNSGGHTDSKERLIYIHGTPEEGLIGTPSSHGCIRMKNADVVELYKNISVGIYVIILNN